MLAQEPLLRRHRLDRLGDDPADMREATQRLLVGEQVGGGVVAAGLDPLPDQRGEPARFGEQLVMLAKDARSEEHTSELQSLIRNSYAVFCLKTNNKTTPFYTQTPNY